MRYGNKRRPPVEKYRKKIADSQKQYLEAVSAPPAVDGDGGFVVLTGNMIECGLSHRGQLSQRQLRLIGVEWPLKKGWKKTVIGRRIPIGTYRLFLSLRS